MPTFPMIHSLPVNGDNNTRVVNIHVDKDYVNILLGAFIADEWQQ